MQTIYIKNMVCNRCISAVQHSLQEVGVAFQQVALGEVKLNEPLTAAQKQDLHASLEENGFVLLEDKQATLIDRIRTIIIEMIHYNGERPRVNYSAYISEKLHYDYKYLSSLFSAVEGTTIEKYIILQKVEKIKEMLFYDEMSLKEIAYAMGYSSVQHLSNQFKKVTGLSPTAFRTMKTNARRPLDQLR